MLPVASIPGSGNTSDGFSNPSHLKMELLQCSLGWAAFEDQSEATVGSECSSGALLRIPWKVHGTLMLTKLH